MKKMDNKAFLALMQNTISEYVENDDLKGLYEKIKSYHIKNPDLLMKISEMIVDECDRQHKTGKK